MCAWLTSQRVPFHFGLSFSRRINGMWHVRWWCATVGQKPSTDDANDDDAMLSQLTISIISRCRFSNSPIRYWFYLKKKNISPLNCGDADLAAHVSSIAWLMGLSKKIKSLAQRQSMNVGTTTSFQLHCSTESRLLFAISITFSIYSVDWSFSVKNQKMQLISNLMAFCGQMTCAKWECTFIPIDHKEI